MTTPPNEQPQDARGDKPFDYAGWLAEKRAHNKKLDTELVAAFDRIAAPGIENDPEFAYTAFTWFASGWNAGRTNAHSPEREARSTLPNEPRADGRNEAVVAAPLATAEPIPADDPRSYLRQILGIVDARQLGGTLWRDAFDSLLKSLPTAAPPPAQQAPHTAEDKT